MVSNVGKENVWDLVDVRVCDRVGTGRPKENPYRLRKYKSMIDEVMRDPISVSMLKIDGKRIMEITNTAPGPRVGWALNALLEEVLEDPTLNNIDYLEKRVFDFYNMDDKDLKKLGEKGKEKKEEEDKKMLKNIRDRHNVQ
jgi:poly(A) polymerase/tRNA nucleotidyltransferase (CCA-adding enzyme)